MIFSSFILAQPGCTSAPYSAIMSDCVAPDLCQDVTDDTRDKDDHSSCRLIPGKLVSLCHHRRVYITQISASSKCEMGSKK